MYRRQFLALAPLAALTAAVKPRSIGGHCWVYAAPLPRYDPTPALDRIFADMKWAGLDGVELMHQVFEDDNAVARVRELSRKHGIPLLGTSYEAPMWNRDRAAGILEYADRLITRVAAAGGRTLGTSVGHANRRKTDAELDAQADIVRKLIEMGAAKGVAVNLHNHTYEVVDGEWDLKGTLARVPEAKLGPDLNWLVRGGVDPAEFIRRHGKRIVFAHIRDQKADGKWSEAVGEGAMDYRAIGRALSETGFSGDLAIELAHERGFTPARPLRESWKMSREFVERTVLGRS